MRSRAGGFGDRGIEGKIQASVYARENRIPYLASAWGCSSRSSNMRAMCWLSRGHSTEFDRATITGDRAHHGWQDLARGQQVRDEKSEMGGTMRWVRRKRGWFRLAGARAVRQGSIYERTGNR